MDRNTDYIVLMNNIRGGSQVATLSRQMNTLNPNFLLTSAFKDATSEPFGHLLIDAKASGNDLLRYRGNIFNTDFVSVYQRKN